MAEYLFSHPIALRGINDGLPAFVLDEAMPAAERRRQADIRIRAVIFRLRAQGVGDAYLPSFFRSAYPGIAEAQWQAAIAALRDVAPPLDVVLALQREAEARALATRLLFESLQRCGFSLRVAENLANRRIATISTAVSPKQPDSPQAREQIRFLAHRFGPALQRIGMSAQTIANMLRPGF
ncbi:hypothetical protein [Chitinimonas sp.]|uniref:hypothetical protein n=1 Tax=Chitinimonas sp. TaxID=1934313 RepID=UPI0035B011D5